MGKYAVHGGNAMSSNRGDTIKQPVFVVNFFLQNPCPYHGSAPERLFRKIMSVINIDSYNKWHFTLRSK
jgi:hypothetical protein